MTADDSELVFGTGTIVTPPVMSALILRRTANMPRRYWIAMWIGWYVGPLVMALMPPCEMRFGVVRDGKFKWIEVHRDR